MVTLGGQTHPYTGDPGPITSVSGRAQLIVNTLHWEGPRSTAALASFTSGGFLQITLSGGSTLGYIQYLVSA